MAMTPAPLRPPRVPGAAALVAAALLAGCATSAVYRADRAAPAPMPRAEPAHVVLLAGNAGDLRDPAAIARLGADARRAGPASTVVLLGDQAGAHDALASALDGYAGRVVLVRGDRDADLGDQAAALRAALPGHVEAPDTRDGAAELRLLPSLRLVALDTPAWLGRADAEAAPAEAAPAEAAVALERLVLDRDDEQVLVVGHHPLRSNGASAGHRTALRGAATLGVEPLLASAVGLGPGALATPAYRAFCGAVERALGQHGRLVYASAGDPSLQAFSRPVNGGRAAQTFLVSGSAGGAVGAAVGGRGADLVAPRPGYWRLSYYPDGRLWGEAVAVDRAGRAEVVYQAALSGPDPRLADPVPVAAPTFDAPRGPVVRAADADFETGPFRNDPLTRAVAGAGYRDAWRTPVALPVLDLAAEAGGLTPARPGGGNQTTSLRLDGADGHTYDLRLVEKGGTGGLPERLRDGLAGDLVLDLRSAALPYAALVAADLAASAGLLAPQPRLVYVPDDPRLGDYRAAFGGRTALLVVRPDDDMSDLDGWAGVTDVVSDEKLREELAEDHDHRVDAHAYARARLLDLVVGDWDRHAGNWRWAPAEPVDLDPALTGDAATRGKVYRPVPRDRDWAFYDLGGLVQRALFRTDRRYQPYGPGFGSVLGLTQNARGQDRRFLASLSRAEVQAAAADLRARLSDDAIDRALGTLPPEVHAVVGADWRAALRARRDALDHAARRLHAIAAHVVDVVGSDDREAFEVVPNADGGVVVTVRAFADGEPGRELFRRAIAPGETREVRLYGLGGRDRFVVASGAAVPVRVVGGAGHDEVASAVATTRVHDTPDGVTIGGRARDRTTPDPGVHRYDEDAAVMPVVVASPTVASRATDGALLGGRLTVTTHGFRARPYARQHVLAADVATATGGVRGRYAGHYRGAAGPFDVRLDAEGATPRNARNYYGLGNGSAGLPTDVARLDLARAAAAVRFELPIGPGARASLGPTVRYADPQRDDDLAGPLAALPDEAFRPQTHAGAVARLDLSTVDVEANPRQGARVRLEAAALGALGGASASYGTLAGEAAAFVPLRIGPQWTLALRLGGEHRLGSFPFFDAAVVGQDRSVRGYRRERFAGRSAAFGTAELRAKLVALDTYVLPLDVGALAFADAGRVWISDAPRLAALDRPPVASGSGLQVGLGGGLWVGVLDRATAVLTVARSDEDTLVTLGGGFHF